MWQEIAKLGLLSVTIGCWSALAVIAHGDDRAKPELSFRVTVTDVLIDEDCLVKQLRIESTSEFLVKVASVGPNLGGLSGSAQIPDGSGAYAATLAVLVDHVTRAAGEVDTLKFLMALKTGGGKASMSDTGPMPAGRTVGDLLEIKVKPGSHRLGTTIPLARYKNIDYVLVVERRPN